MSIYDAVQANVFILVSYKCYILRDHMRTHQDNSIIYLCQILLKSVKDALEAYGRPTVYYEPSGQVFIQFFHA